MSDSKMTRIPLSLHQRIATQAKFYGLSIFRVLTYCIEKGLLDIEESGILLAPSTGQNLSFNEDPGSRIDVILALGTVDFEKFCKTVPPDEANEYWRLRTNIQRKKGGLSPLPPGWAFGDKEPEDVEEVYLQDDEAELQAAEAAATRPGDPVMREIDDGSSE